MKLPFAMKLPVVRAAIVGLVGLVVLAVAGCSPGGASVSPSAAPSAAPATYDDFDTAFCGAFTSLIRAVGNPDLNTPSVMSKALDGAVAAGDGPAAERAAAAMIAELDAGRQQAAAAARWEPGASTASQLDRLLVAFEALTRAKSAMAKHTPGAPDPQKAFEQAGGVQAWTATLQGIGRVPVPAGASPKPCKAFTGQV